MASWNLNGKGESIAPKASFRGGAELEFMAVAVQASAAGPGCWRDPRHPLEHCDAKPPPLSWTSSVSSSARRRDRNRIRPGRACGSMPWRMAFSTSGCRMRLGTLASRVSGAASISTSRRSAESDVFNFEVALQELQLLAQGDFLRFGAVEGGAQQFAQAADHAVGRINILVHERGDRVEAVKQEMGIQLHLERLELRLEPGVFPVRWPGVRDPGICDKNRKRRSRRP